jgi:RNA polymerase sigma factor (sigma-70 family)
MGSFMSRPSALLLRSQSDERLLALAREGHERAFETIVERYRRPLLRACRRVLPEARAEDAVQQTLVAAWTALERGYEVRELRPWLFRVAHNTALNQLRLNGYDHDELVEGLRGGSAPDEEFERRIVVRATLAGIAALPERQREALLRIAVEGRPQEDVAAELGVSEGAVRQLVHRARGQLRAAATAVTPMPVAIWMADIAGGAATAGGVAATAVKAGAAVVLVTGAAAGPALLPQRSPHAGRRDAAAAPPRAHAGVRRAQRVDVADEAATVTPAAATAPRGARRPDAGDDRGRRGDPRSGADDAGRGRGGADDGARRSGGSSRGPAPSSSSPTPERPSGEDRGGSSQGGDGGRDSGSSGDPGSSVGSDSRGGRSGGDDGADGSATSTVVAVAPPSGDDGSGGGTEMSVSSGTSGSSDSGSLVGSGSSSGTGSGDSAVLAEPDDPSHSGGDGGGASSGSD